MVRPERLFGAARLTPSGSPFGRSTRPAAELSNSLVLCREFELTRRIFGARIGFSGKDNNGAPGEIRTPGLLVRSQALYPTELRAHIPNPTCDMAMNQTPLVEGANLSTPR